MHRLAIREDHDAQPSSARLVYSPPPPNSTIGLSPLVFGLCNHANDPFFLYR